MNSVRVLLKDVIIGSRAVVHQLKIITTNLIKIKKISK